MTSMPFQFDNTYARSLPGFYVNWQGDAVPSPRLVVFNNDLAAELGLDAHLLKDNDGAAMFAGVTPPEGAAPLAQVYAGHQFGGFSPQLGDGRALLLGEVIDRQGRRRDIQLKGSGPTPFSRGGDGKAVIGPVLREYIMGEAMNALGIPTTRALAAVTTGETIFRDGPKPGAVLTRVAASHLRVGTFQYFAARGETEKVRQLADYAIARHDPELTDASDKYIAFFRNVVARQADLVAKWVLVGFVHGVMNTDNTTISGETIDYGPCAFIDAYDPLAVFSSIDHGGRYAFGRQPMILQWNLARLAEALLALIDPENSDSSVEQVSEALDKFPDLYRASWNDGMRRKLGFQSLQASDQVLIDALMELLAEQSVDYTLFFRRLGHSADGDDRKLLDLLSSPEKLMPWLTNWRDRLAAEHRSPDDIQRTMNAANPVYVPRNHMVEAALQAAETGDYGPAQTLLDVLKRPFEERLGLESYAEPAPDNFGPYTTFCGT